MGPWDKPDMKPTLEDLENVFSTLVAVWTGDLLSVSSIYNLWHMDIEMNRRIVTCQVAVMCHPSQVPTVMAAGEKVFNCGYDACGYTRKWKSYTSGPFLSFSLYPLYIFHHSRSGQGRSLSHYNFMSYERRENYVGRFPQVKKRTYQGTNLIMIVFFNEYLLSRL